MHNIKHLIFLNVPRHLGGVSILSFSHPDKYDPVTVIQGVFHIYTLISLYPRTDVHTMKLPNSSGHEQWIFFCDYQIII